MRVTIFLTLDRAGRVKTEVKEVVHKAGDYIEVDNTAKADALTACDTSGTADIELLGRGLEGVEADLRA
jgi:hypothetical protein